MTHFMAYVVLLSAGIAACALATEFPLRARRHPTRWIWVGALAAVLAVIGVATFAPLPSIQDVPRAVGTAVALGNADGAPLVMLADRMTGQPVLRIVDGILPALWLLTTAVLLGAIIYGQRRLRIERATSTKARLNGRDVLLTDSIGPAVAGIGSPVVFVPRWALALDAASQELMLAHEFEHLKQGDTRLLLAGAVAAALMPWNPVAWWIARRLRLAVEQDCDARVLGVHPDVRRYADLLLMAASQPRVSARLLAAHFGEHRSDLDRRIQAMTDRSIRWRSLLTAAGAAGVLLVASCEAPRPEPVAPLGSREPSAEPSRVQYEEIATPMLVSGSSMPKYPAILREAGVEGEVLVSFDIDETGIADPATFKVIRATHELFAAAVREALPAMRFRPAERAGRKVKLTVEEPFTFTLTDARSPEERVALAKGALSEVVVTAVPERKLPTVVLRSDRSQVTTNPPNVVVVAFDGKELARSGAAQSSDLLSKIAPETIHSVEVLKGNSCAPYECPLIKITLARGKTLGTSTLVRPRPGASAAGAWEPKAETRRTTRPNLDSILNSPMNIELLTSSGVVIARYGSRAAFRAINFNSEDISASEAYRGTYCKAGSPCPLTRIWLKPGREAAYKKQ